MRKVIYSIRDIADEFLTRAMMKGLTHEQIIQTLPTICEEGFQLVRTIKVLGTRRKVYMVEWIDEGHGDSDEWLRPPENFLGAFAEGYVKDASKHAGNVSEEAK